MASDTNENEPASVVCTIFKITNDPVSVIRKQVTTKSAFKSRTCLLPDRSPLNPRMHAAPVMLPAPASNGVSLGHANRRPKYTCSRKLQGRSCHAKVCPDDPGCGRSRQTRPHVARVARAPLRTWNERARNAQRIQRIFRQWHACVPYIRVLCKARVASRRIQSWWRMHLRSGRSQSLWSNMVKVLVIMDSAARRLQRCFRNVLLRRSYHCTVVSVLKIQAWWRAFCLRGYWRVRSRAVARVQQWWRCVLIKLRLQACIRLVCFKIQGAAVKLQSVWRGILARKQCRWHIEQLHKARVRRRYPVRRMMRSPSKTCSANQDVNFTMPMESERRCTAPASLNRNPSGPHCNRFVFVGPGTTDGVGVKASPTIGECCCSPPRSARSPTQERLRRSSSVGSPCILRYQARGSSHGTSSVRPARQNSPRSSPAALGTRKAVAPEPETRATFESLIRNGVLVPVAKITPTLSDKGDASDFSIIAARLASSLPGMNVRRLFRVECPLAAAAYSAVQNVLGPQKLLWHGTSWDSVANIAQNGFNRAYSGRHGVKLGRGTYFAESAAFALRFCGRHTANSSSSRALFLAGVLPGWCCRGEEGLVEPPTRCEKTGARYDSTVDDPNSPKVVCVFRDFQALPLYLAEVL